MWAASRACNGSAAETSRFLRKTLNRAGLPRVGARVGAAVASGAAYPSAIWRRTARARSEPGSIIERMPSK